VTGLLISLVTRHNLQDPVRIGWPAGFYHTRRSSRTRACSRFCWVSRPAWPRQFPRARTNSMRPGEKSINEATGSARSVELHPPACSTCRTRRRHGMHGIVTCAALAPGRSPSNSTRAPEASDSRRTTVDLNGVANAPRNAGLRRMGRTAVCLGRMPRKPDRLSARTSDRRQLQTQKRAPRQSGAALRTVQHEPKDSA